VTKRQQILVMTGYFFIVPRQSAGKLAHCSPDRSQGALADGGTA